jgi:flagellar biosynthetic protein FlhB
LSGEDRTEAPTPKRKKQAREEGRIARSPDLGAWLTILVCTFVLPGMMGGVLDALEEGLAAAGDLPAQPEGADAMRVFGTVFRDALLALLPLLAVIATIGLVVSLAQVGVAFSAKAMKPKFTRLNPVNGIKQLFSKKQTWELAKSVLKLAVLASVAYRSVKGIATGLVALGPFDLQLALEGLSRDVLSLVRLCASLGLGIAIVDYAVQRRRTAKELRMTKQEVKEEHRSSEGDPHMKAKMKGLRLAFSRNRMIAAVPKADVVLTNPTHVAVAIQYDKAIGVPTVVAVGGGAVAARIRAVAAEAKVPIVEDKPLARALFNTCDVGDAIPRELFEGVAKVLAFVYALGRTAATWGGQPLRMPGGTVRATPEPLGGRHTRGVAKRAAKRKAMAERRAQKRAAS